MAGYLVSFISISGALILPLAAYVALRRSEPWVLMWGLALATFVSCKWLMIFFLVLIYGWAAIKPNLKL